MKFFFNQLVELNRWNRFFGETEPVELNRLFNNRLWTEPCTTNRKLEPNRTESNRYHAAICYMHRNYSSQTPNSYTLLITISIMIRWFLVWDVLSIFCAPVGQMQAGRMSQRFLSRLCTELWRPQASQLPPCNCQPQHQSRKSGKMMNTSIEFYKYLIYLDWRFS